jgi:hypothetical protein
MNLQILKKIARSNEAQILYNRAKELNIRLFNNDNDLSKMQIWYLYFLELYHILYQDLNTGEDYISEEIIDDDIRTEAYLLLRKERKEKKEKSSTRRLIDSTIKQDSVVFKRKSGK